MRPLVLFLAVLALVGGACSDAGSESTSIDETSTTIGGPATVDDLDAAVSSAIGALSNAPGVEGMQVAYIGRYLAGAVWFDYRRDGDLVVVQRADVDVTGTAWWLSASQPPAVGVNVWEAVWVMLGDAFYEASSGGVWSARPPEARPEDLTLGVEMLTEGSYLLEPADDGVASRSAADNGEEWTLTSPYRDGSVAQTWRIKNGGALEAYAWEKEGVSASADDALPWNTGSIAFTQLTDPEPIESPQIGAAPDLSVYGVPDDLPLGPG